MYPLSFFKQQVANCCPPFGEQVDLMEPADKVTETFTGKERDDETELNYFGARYLDPMLGLWVSVDPARQFASPYLYAGNGVNPVNGVDDDGRIIHLANNQMQLLGYINQVSATQYMLNERNELVPANISKANGSGNQYFSDRLNAAIESSDVLDVLVGDADATYIDDYSGQIECQITGKFNGNSSPAQNLLHEMVSHGIPIMLDDRDPTASAVEEEQKAVDGVFPVDVPDHIIDQRYEE
ncbi:MAG: RHS repeat-associated core domain-containing protein [Fibrobacter sp.]|nr:RHS repeat-associated core domain-containing protein [Fibrobacter sp.]